jgi:hypothetical protein
MRNGPNNPDDLITSAASGNPQVVSYSWSNGALHYGCSFWAFELGRDIGASIAYSDIFNYFIVGSLYADPSQVGGFWSRWRYFNPDCSGPTYDAAYSFTTEGVNVAY